MMTLRGGLLFMITHGLNRQILSFLLLSQSDSKAKLQATIQKDLESSHNYPYIVSLSALSAGFCSESDASFVSSVQSILSQRIFEAKPENRWHFIYAVEQTIQCGHYSYSEITEISKLVHSWRKLELDNNASFQLKHLLFSITGQMSGYLQVDESTRQALDEVFGDPQRGNLLARPPEDFQTIIKSNSFHKLPDYQNNAAEPQARGKFRRAKAQQANGNSQGTK